MKPTLTIGNQPDTTHKVVTTKDYGAISWSCYSAASKAISALTEIAKTHIAKGDKESAIRVERQIARLGRLSQLFLDMNRGKHKKSLKKSVKNNVRK